mgnify:FL=1
MIDDPNTPDAKLCARVEVLGGMRKLSVFNIEAFGYSNGKVGAFHIIGPCIETCHVPKYYSLSESIEWIKNMVKERSEYYQ